MKVALLSLFRFEEVRGGTEIFIEHLKKVFPDMRMITYSTARRNGRHFDFTRLNLEEPKMGLAIGREFTKLQKKEEYDLVIVNNTAGWYLSLFRPDVPMMNIFHFTYRGLAEKVLKGTPGYMPSKYFSPLFEKISVGGKMVVSVSHKTRRELKEHYHVESTVVENAIPTDLFKPIPKEEARAMLGIDYDGPLGIFVGRADHTKGFDIVRSVSRMRDDLKIMCVTPTMVSDDRLIIHRNIPNERMPLYYSAADFFLFPSRYESVGYTALEAMSCDLPVVASRTGIFEDLDTTSVGSIVPTFDPEDYSAAIDTVLSDDSLRPRKIAVDRFGMNRFIDGYKSAAKDAVLRHHTGTRLDASIALSRL